MNKSYNELLDYYKNVSNEEIILDMMQDYDISLSKLQRENKKLKEELENDIDRYEDTISYQLGFDKGKEYLQQRIDKTIENIKITIKIIKEQPSSCELNDIWTLEHLNSFLEILGDEKK